MQPRNLKLEKSIEPFKHNQPQFLKTKVMWPMGAAYERNIRRVYSLIMLPLAAVNVVTITERITYQVTAKIKERVRATGVRLTEKEYQAAIRGAIEADADEREATIKAGGKPAQDLLQRETLHGFEVLSSLLSTHLAEGAEAWLSAQVTGIWTAFEALSEDLWEATVNTHPRGLAELKGTKKSGRADEDRSIRLDLLQKYDYDVSASMGTVLKGKYSFDTLEGIRRAYADAGFEDDQKIKDIMADRALDALALVRNLIVHSGGIIDEQFLRRKADLPPEAIANVGDQMPMDGALVEKLTKPAIQLGWDLIVAIDEWLAARGAEPSPATAQPFAYGGSTAAAHITNPK
jgi:hypothetical protein